MTAWRLVTSRLTGEKGGKKKGKIKGKNIKGKLSTILLYHLSSCAKCSQCKDSFFLDISFYCYCYTYIPVYVFCVVIIKPLREWKVGLLSFVAFTPYM